MQIADNGANFDGRVDLPQSSFRSDRLGQIRACILFIKQHLPLQIAQLDNIAIDDRQMPDTCPRQLLGSGSAQGPASNHDNPRARQLLLPNLPNPRKQRLARIAIGRTGVCCFHYINFRPRL